MSVTLERLQALKRQSSGTLRSSATARKPTTSVATTPRVPGPPDIDSLRALLRGRGSRLTPPTSRSIDRTLPGEEIAPGLFLHTSRLPYEGVPSELDGAFDRRESLARDSLLFFDTETTGLAGGVGTRAFMIGASHFEGQELVVRQLLTATLGAEAAMLRELASWLRPDSILVSFNGKCYDAPLLRARFRLARLPDPTAGLAHVDLLFPTRRRYKGVYENCRLATIERRVLRIVREDDLPGSEAPAAWLGYLRGGSSALLRRVGHHNHQDVLTLAELMAHLCGVSDR